MLCITLLGFSSPASALDINHFKPSLGENNFVVISSTDTVSKGNFQMDFFYNYTYGLLEGKVGGITIDLVEHQNFINVGIVRGFTDRFHARIYIPYLTGFRF